MPDRQAIKFYDKGLSAHQNGRLGEAERAYKKAISISDDFVEAHNNLGNVLLDRGQFSRATMAYKKALTLMPQHPMLLSNVGNALQLQGQHEKAIDWCNKAIQQDPDYADAYNNLGNALAALGNTQAASEAYQKTLQLNPNQVGAHTNLANLELLMGQFAEAEQSFRKVLTLAPNQLQAALGLGDALYEQDRNSDAIAVYRKALLLEPKSIIALNGLGNALYAEGNLSEAIESYDAALQLDPGYWKSMLGKGTALGEQGQFAEAKEVISKVISLQPSSIEAHIALSNLYGKYGEKDLAIESLKKSIELDPERQESLQLMASLLSDYGDLQQAVALYRQILGRVPDNTEAYRDLTTNLKFTGSEPELAAMTALYDQPGLSDHKRMHLAFALGKANEDLGDYETSFRFTAEANRLNRATLSYQTGQTQSLFERIKKTFSADLFDNKSDIGSTDSSPIFIVGMPRSGTSLTEQILSSHPEVFGAGELKNLGALLVDKTTLENCGEFPEAFTDIDEKFAVELGDSYVRSVQFMRGEAQRFVDKLPHNFQYVGLIKLILPNAKVIHCRRDPMDNCLSIFKNFFSATHAYAYNLTELGEYYRLYTELMQHWREVLPGFMFELDYEALVGDQEPQTRRLLEFCQLDWHDACLSFDKTQRKVKTASNAQVRRPIYRDSVALWKRYENQLQPLQQAIYG